MPGVQQGEQGIPHGAPPHAHFPRSLEKQKQGSPSHPQQDEVVPFAAFESQANDHGSLSGERVRLVVTQVVQVEDGDAHASRKHRGQHPCGRHFVRHQKSHAKYADKPKKKHDVNISKSLISIGLFSHGVAHSSHNTRHAKSPEEAHACPVKGHPLCAWNGPRHEGQNQRHHPGNQGADRGEGHALFHGRDGQLSGGQCPIRAASSSVRALHEVAVIVGKIGQDLKKHHCHQGPHNHGCEAGQPRFIQAMGAGHRPAKQHACDGQRKRPEARGLNPWFYFH